MNIKFWLGVAYIAVIGALSNVVGMLIKREGIRYGNFPFKPFKWERNGRIYDSLGIRKWKDKLPDVSRHVKFLLPKKIRKGVTSGDLNSLIKETCVAEIIHIMLIVLSLAVLFICPGIEGVLLYTLCVCGNLPFIFIQRYNRPQFHKAILRLNKREERKNQCAF